MTADLTTTNVVTTFVSANKGELVTVFLADGTTATGIAISVNSKGVNLKMEDGKTRSFGLSRVKGIGPADQDDVDAYDDEAAAELTDALNDVADSISDGATTAEVAAALSGMLERELTPKELRVHLRALGLGVGKGRKYALSAGELRAVHTLITEAAPATV